jgi:fructose-1,6-bisphosphatase/inositol monophosphatase family enzyme
MMIDTDHVSGLIRAAVEAKILPRFRNLAEGEIAQKGPNDPVTIADIEAEEMLSRLLLEAYPETRVIGEELVSREPATLDALLGDTPVWVIDPVDGTMNFADGNPVFGTILAYVVGGQTKAGWIHDPINNVTVTALLGGGAWSDGRRLEVNKATPLNRSSGSAYWTSEDWLVPDPGMAASGLFGELRNHRCSAADYIDLALGRRQFVLSTGSKPWDHAAGVLIAREAGGLAGFLDGSDYSVTELDGRVVATATEEAMRAIREVAGRPA